MTAVSRQDGWLTLQAFLYRYASLSSAVVAMLGVDHGPCRHATPSASPSGMQTMKVPADFIIYKCKIGGGKIIDIALPPTFRQVDVDKLHAFLKTQIDDE